MGSATALRATLAGLALVLAGCASGQNAGNAVPGVEPNLQWEIDQSPSTLVLTLDDARAFFRLEDATLRGPAGQSIAAREISRRDTDQVGYGGPFGGVGVGVGGGSRSGVGVGVSVPIFRSGRSGDRRQTEVVFAIPDAGAGLIGWPAEWVVDLALIDKAGIASSAEIPVPAP